MKYLYRVTSGLILARLLYVATQTGAREVTQGVFIAGVIAIVAAVLGA